MDFWDVFWILLIFIPLLLVWVFAIVDVFRRQDLAGWAQALWLLAILVLPFVGTLLYLILRPPPDVRFVDELKTLADLHDQGMLSDAEYAESKARLLG